MWTIRGLLALGSLVFALSAVALLVMPSAFATLLGLTPTSDLDWALRMMGAVLVALAGQMWLVRHTPDPSTRGAAAVMVLGGGLMTIMTVWLPGEWSTLRWAYLGFGLGWGKYKLDSRTKTKGELELDDADSVFVYNAMIGVLIPITEVASASIGYRYIAAEGTDNIGGIINDVSQDIESEFDAHEISLGLRFHF